MSPARARTRTARSGDERTNHEATALKAPEESLGTSEHKVPSMHQEPVSDHKIRSYKTQEYSFVFIQERINKMSMNDAEVRKQVSICLLAIFSLTL